VVVRGVAGLESERVRVPKEASEMKSLFVPGI
jgi:hypothetical protein